MGAFQKHRLKVLFAGMLLLACLCLPASANKLIVHPDVILPHTSKETVRALFAMRLRRWPSGELVRVFVLPDRNPVHRAFSKRKIGVFPHQLRRAWDRRVFSGVGQAPTLVKDEAEMLNAVVNTPGGVGYVSDSTEVGGARVVPVE